jgi:Replication protein
VDSLAPSVQRPASWEGMESSGGLLERRLRRRELRRAGQALARWATATGDDSLKGVTHCGHAVSGGVSLRVPLDGGPARECGVFSCGRIWLCPVCSASIRSKRAAELDVASDAWKHYGGRLMMMTLTVRHSRSVSLDSLLDGLLGAWKDLRGRASYRRVRELEMGSVKALEITDGENGWHPHLHVLYFVPFEVTDEAAVASIGCLSDEWIELVTRRLGVSPTAAHGFDVRMLDGPAAYISKVGPELAMADTKSSSRTPFDRLAAAADGDHVALARWLEYARAIHGKASLMWSPGLRDRFGLEVEQDDAAIAAAAEVVESELGPVVLVIPSNVHRRLVVTGAIEDVLRRVGDGWRPSEWLPSPPESRSPTVGDPAHAPPASPERARGYSMGASV